MIPPRSSTGRPVAELRDDQRDDQSLPPYDELDPIIEAYVEDDLLAGRDRRGRHRDARDRRSASRGSSTCAEYKRRQAPPGMKLHPKAFGRDRRVPITNRYKPS